MTGNLTAFISYSWDNKEHQNWVNFLADKLNAQGIKTTMDIFETKHKTVHLGQMMATNIQKNDYTLVIMTPDYAERADNNIGGVGIDSQLLMNVIKENQNQVIPILRGDAKQSVPFYLEQYNYINFKNDNDFDESFKELLQRISYKSNQNFENEVNTQTINTTEELNSKNLSSNNIKNDLIPNFMPFTDLARSKEIHETFQYLQSKLKSYLENTEEQNDNFNYVLEENSDTKILISMDLNGNMITKYKIWIGNLFGSRKSNIYIAEGWNTTASNDKNFNDFIDSVEEKGQIIYKRSMRMFGDKEFTTKEELFKSIWEEIVQKLKQNPH